MSKSMMIRDVSDAAIQALKVTAALRSTSMAKLAKGLIEGTGCPWPGCTHSHEWHVEKRNRSLRHEK